jgi:hypothetical protein
LLGSWCIGGFVPVDINCLGPGKNLAIALALLARNGTFETPRERPIAAQASATAIMTRLPGAWHQLDICVMNAVGNSGRRPAASLRELGAHVFCDLVLRLMIKSRKSKQQKEGEGKFREWLAHGS